MARVHAHRRGKSHSTRPPFPRPPAWVNYSRDEIISLVIKLAKEGVPPSKIGLILRDEYGIPLVKPIVGMSITQILREGGVQFQVPEDLQNLLRKAQSIQRHLSENRGDKRNIHNLELVEARIHRLAKYYKRRGLLPADWKYSAVVAQLA